MESLKPVKCVVVPAFPPIDKFVAYKRVLLDLGEKFRLEVAFCDVNMPTPEHYATWNGMCTPNTGDAYLIDVGEKKYHKLARSASEVEKMSSGIEDARTWNRLVELVNENNQSGMLKKMRHSVPKLIRDIYHVMKSGIISQGVVFDHGMDVVNAEFFPLNKRSWESLFNNPEFADLKTMWYGFSVQEKDVLPFTLPMYFRRLFMSGRSVQEIKEKLSWWIDKQKRVKKAREVAKAKKYFPKTFSVAGNPGALIAITGYFEFLAFVDVWIRSGNAAIGIVRNELGHVQIQSSIAHPGANFTRLAAFLEKIEPGRWRLEARFQEGRIQMFMNGSPQFTGVRPTNLSDDQLISVVCRLVTFDPQ